MINSYPLLACCTFPTKIILIDDEPAMADSLRLMPLPIGLHLESFTDPEQALTALSTYQPNITEEMWLQADQTSELWDGIHKQPIMLDIKRIDAIAQHPARQTDISIVIVDYQMPAYNGLQVLQQLKNQPFKKILLTAERTLNLAVDAFNRGLIDQFLRKDDVQLHEKLAASILRLKRQYFIDLCQKSLKFLAKNSPIFSNTAIAELFYQKITALDIIEFYLIDMQGGFRLIDKSGTTLSKKYLLLYASKHVELITQYAKDNHASASVLDALESRSSFPFFGELKTYWQIHPKEWERYLHPLKAINIKQKIFYECNVNSNNVVH